ncbi:hypothetical protein [Jonesia quinghaiensis]|uniref:hypothetical protein n=1 Tax=Jonesia quinghaiensis TaxID=262806 RepID=UPI0003FA1C5A|nr:hypothetical protein [Jonesia quinghaiensis]
MTALTISAFFMVWIALGWQFHHTAYGRNATALGYSGPGVEVVALYDPSPGSADNPVADIASLFDLSIAYERQLNSGVLTITDPEQRFNTQGGPLLPHDLAHNETASWVGVSEAVPITDHDVAVSISPDFHGTVLDPVPSGLSLIGSLQAAYVSQDIQPFIDGRYYFAGEYVADTDGIDHIVGRMEAQGFSIVAVTPFADNSNLSRAIESNMSGRYLIVLGLFFTVVVVSTYVVLQGHAAAHRKNLEALAVCGGDSRHLKRATYSALLKPVLAGFAIALVVSSGLHAYLQPLSGIAHAEAISIIVLPLSAAMINLFAIAKMVTNRAVRKVGHVLPL